jgi:hypothetical protein
MLIIYGFMNYRFLPESGYSSEASFNVMNCCKRPEAAALAGYWLPLKQGYDPLGRRLALQASTVRKTVVRL